MGVIVRTAFPIALLLLPAPAAAQAISQISGLFNIMAGLMLVISFLLFFGGLGLWFVRLGTWPTYRDQAIDMMTWGLAVLIVLAVLLMIVQFVQQNQGLTMFAIGVAIVLGVAWMAVQVSKAKGGGDEGAH